MSHHDFFHSFVSLRYSRDFPLYYCQFILIFWFMRTWYTSVASRYIHVIGVMFDAYEVQQGTKCTILSALQSRTSLRSAFIAPVLLLIVELWV